MPRRPQFTREGALAEVQGELVAEMAHTLGRSGRKMEAALDRLAAFDAAADAPERRAVVLKAASTAVWHFFIQREVCGMRDHRSVIAQYAIPEEVLRRLGAF